MGCYKEVEERACKGTTNIMNQMLTKDLVFDHLEAETYQEVLRFLAQQLYEKGKVKDTYEEAVLTREEEFPTGLMTSELGFAIPHTDACYVNENAFAIAKLESPVKFHHMADAEEMVDAEVVIMMSIANDQNQVPVLSSLLTFLSSEGAGEKIRKANNKEELYECFADQLNHLEMKGE